MTDAELLQHYIQCKRIIHGVQRSPGHHPLLKLGFIEEHPVSIKNLLITVTAAGRTAIDCRPAEYVGTHPTLWGLIPLTPQKRPRTMSASRDPVAPPTRLDWLTCRTTSSTLSAISRTCMPASIGERIGQHPSK